MFEILIFEIKRLITDYYLENNDTYISVIEKVINELTIWKSQ